MTLPKLVRSTAGFIRPDFAIGVTVLGLVFAESSGLPAPPSQLSQWAGIAAALLVPVVGWFLRGKLKEIHVLVNSNLSRAQSDLAIAIKRIDDLEHVIGKITGAVKLPGGDKPKQSADV